MARLSWRATVTAAGQASSARYLPLSVAFVRTTGPVMQTIPLPLTASVKWNLKVGVTGRLNRSLYINKATLPHFAGFWKLEKLWCLLNPGKYMSIVTECAAGLARHHLCAKSVCLIHLLSAFFSWDASISNSNIYCAGYSFFAIAKHSCMYHTIYAFHLLNTHLFITPNHLVCFMFP